MRVLLLISVMLMLSSCLIIMGPGEGEGTIVLENMSGETLFFLALERDLSYRVDPMPSFPPDDVPFPSVDAGEATTVDEIEGYEAGDDVTFFLYAFRDVRDVQRVVLVHLKEVTAEELDDHHGRVIIGPL